MLGRTIRNTLHNFDTDHPDTPVIGSFPLLRNVPLPPLHGYSVTLSVKAGDVPLPPQGVFDWHYIQCVIT